MPLTLYIKHLCQNAEVLFKWNCHLNTYNNRIDNAYPRDRQDMPEFLKCGSTYLTQPARDRT